MIRLIVAVMAATIVVIGWTFGLNVMFEPYTTIMDWAMGISAAVLVLIFASFVIEKFR
jgi:hypothetical protein